MIMRGSTVYDAAEYGFPLTNARTLKIAYT